MKKIMFLGGSTPQLTAIKYAKEQGYHTILCDYSENNPGRDYCDEYYSVSTTDKEAVLEIAKKAEIDGIVAYVSEVSSATAAYVANKLNLPSNSYETVQLLSNKSLFRAFLKSNGFNYPKSKTFKTVMNITESLSGFQYPLMVKPVDSSGSRGITRIDCKEDLNKAFEYALSESPKKTLIIEEYIEMAHECIIGGDIIVQNGEIVFFGKINGHRNIEKKIYIPFGNSYPSFVDDSKLACVQDKIQKVIDILNIKTGVLNIDVLIDKNNKPYIIEMAARNGGNMISELLEITTGLNLVEVTVEMALNKKNFEIPLLETDLYYSTYYLHSFEKGKLENITFKDEIKDNITKAIKKLTIDYRDDLCSTQGHTNHLC